MKAKKVWQHYGFSAPIDPDILASGMSAFGQDRAAGLEAKPASPVGEAETPNPCRPTPSGQHLMTQDTRDKLIERYRGALEQIIAADQHTGQRADISFDLDGPCAEIARKALDDGGEK
jgi:hypothetical protein